MLLKKKIININCAMKMLKQTRKILKTDKIDQKNINLLISLVSIYIMKFSYIYHDFIISQICYETSKFLKIIPQKCIFLGFINEKIIKIMKLLLKHI